MLVYNKLLHKPKRNAHGDREDVRAHFDAYRRRFHRAPLEAEFPSTQHLNCPRMVGAGDGDGPSLQRKNLQGELSKLVKYTNIWGASHLEIYLFLP